MLALLTHLLPGAALAESASVLPKGGVVLYSGLGLSSFSSLSQTGADGETDVVLRDRGNRARLDLYGSMGLLPGLQLSASVPLVASWVSDDPDLLPCPQLLQAESYCAPYFTVGQGRLDLRYGLRRKGPGPQATVGLAANVDRWNAARRGQYNSAGTGRSQIEALLVTGGEVDAGDWRLGALLLGAYGLSLAPDVTPASGGPAIPAPADTVRASLEVKARPPGSVTVEAGAHLVQRVGGVPLDAAWVPEWFGSSLDRWNVLAWRALLVSGKISVDLPSDMGLHLGYTRSVAVAEGASDLSDISLGWHRYFKPR